MRPRRVTPEIRAALAFTLAYTAAAGVGVGVTGNREFVVYLVVDMAAIVTVCALHRRVGFSPAVVWGLSLLGAAHMAGGLFRPPEGWPVEGRRVLYNLWLIPDRLKFDQIVHFYGSAIVTWVCWQWLRSAAGLTRPTVGLVMLCALAGTGLGAINEVIEFLTTRVVSDTNVGGFENTGWDLVANLAGATATAGLLVIAGNRRTLSEAGRLTRCPSSHTGSVSPHDRKAVPIGPARR